MRFVSPLSACGLGDKSSPPVGVTVLRLLSGNEHGLLNKKNSMKWVTAQRGWQTQDWRMVPIGWWILSPPATAFRAAEVRPLKKTKVQTGTKIFQKTYLCSFLIPLS